MVGHSESGRGLSRSQEVLVLYRERSGEKSYGDAAVVSAGAFSIQRLEGSRFGMVVLWVLNGGQDGESWRKREWIARRQRNQCFQQSFARRASHVADDAGTRITLVLEFAAKS